MSSTVGDPLPDADGAPAPTLVEDVYDTLLAAIGEGRIAAGTPLSQNKLAVRIGVSRTPVREALLRLERDGLVQRIPEMGFVVASITPKEVEEACDVLQVLDTFVYVRAAETLSPDELAELNALADHMVTSADSGDTLSWRTTDDRYHAIVMDAADNRIVADVLQQQRRRVQRFALPKADLDGRLRTCSQDHAMLARAMADGDRDALEAAVTAHIDRLRHNVLARLESARALLPGPDPLAGIGTSSTR